MAIKNLIYVVDVFGVTPSTEQFGGTQGDHKVTNINFMLSGSLYENITNLASDSKLLYRFDVYDGEGGIWSSVPQEITDDNMNFTLEKKHTRFGGKITVYLVITLLSNDNKTELELYSFPAVLQLKNRPEGVQQELEQYESISALVVSAKNNAIAAENSNKELQKFAASIEEKLKNGEFDGVGIEMAQVVDNDLIITYTDGSMQNLGNVKGDQGEQGPQGEKGEKGDMPDVSGFVEKIYADSPSVYGADNNDVVALRLDTPSPTAFASWLGAGIIPRRQSNGNIMTKTPVAEVDCANKAYVDGLVGDVEEALANIVTILGGI